MKEFSDSGVDSRTLRNAAIKKISTLFDDTPEHKLMFSIVETAIRDLSVPRHRDSARRYLSGDMVHAELCGVEPDWVRSVLKKCGIALT